MKYSFVLQAVMQTPWAILPAKLAVIEEIVERHLSGEKLTAEEIQARINGRTRPEQRNVNRVAVLPVFGTIVPRADLFTDISGATSAEGLGKTFAELMDDPSIDAVVLDVDSPGGQVNGIPELSKQIFDARGKKPVVAVANHTMASAAYWIGTAADEVVVTPSGEVGSIGVFTMHRDVSGMQEKAGIKTTLISRGKYKVEGNPYEPLAEEARAALDERVGESYDAFIEAVARNRGVNPAAVRNGFGEGRVVGANQALKLGMVDSVGTLDETVNRLLQSTSVSNSRAKASSDPAQADFEHEAQSLRDYVQLYK